MTERPIIFSTPMVSALLAGTKTQTRRALRAQPPSRTLQVSTWHHSDPRPRFYAWQGDPAQIAPDWCYPCPYGAPGDRLWVRETWGFNPDFPGMPGHACYRADPGQEYDGIRWRPSIHMPRAASRITLEITGVRVERLQDISEADALAEGPAQHPDGPRHAYRSLWTLINGRSSWDADPWVWVVEFRRVTP